MVVAIDWVTGRSTCGAEDRAQVGLMYSQAMVKPVEVAETGRAMPLVIKQIEN